MSTALRLGFVFLLALLVHFASPDRVQAQHLEEVFRNANKAYFAGDFEGALDGYAQLEAAGIDDPDLWFNLATAHGRLAHHGHAILYFERAIRLRPSDEEAREGLSSVHSALGRRLAEAHGEAMVETRPPFGESLVRPFTEDALALLVLVLDLLFFGALIAFPRIHAESGRLGLGIAIPLFGVLLALSAAGLLIKMDAFGEGERAVIVEDTSLREGPDPRADSRGTLNEGERARVTELEGDWAQVQLSAGRRGWIPRADVGTIQR